MKFRKMSLILLAIVGVALMGTDAISKTMNLIAADVVSSESHLGKAMDFFAQEVEKNTDGKVKIEVYHGGSLGGERDILENLKSGGTIHFAAPGGGMIGIWYRPAEIFTYPYLFKDREHADRVWDKMLKPFTEELADETGFKGMAIWNRPARNLSASKEVKSVADMQGLKIRVPETKMWVSTFKSFGASPTAMAFPEVYTALKTGVIDGQDNPIVLTYTSGFFEVNKYYNLIQHMYQDNMLLTNQSWFSSMPVDIQEAILKAADASQKYCAKLSLEEEQRLMDKAKNELGVTFVEPDLSGFRSSVDGLINDFPHVKKWYDFAKSID